MMKVTCKTVVNSLPIDITSLLSSMLCIVNTSTEPGLLLGGGKVIPRYEMQLHCRALFKGKQLLGHL